MWIQDPKPGIPPVILNKHCPYCYFQKDCEAKAAEKDDLSLLSGMTPKALQKYQKKGVPSASMCSPKKNDSFPAGRIRGLIQALCRCLETALYDAQFI
jgi:hypothetical protein